jgi:serine/threonine protein phosphatase PrpC
MIRISRAHLQVAAVTHPGLAGRQNEDRFAVSAYRLSETDRTPSVFAVLSDGIGGHRAGEVAAEIAVENISRMVEQSNASEPLEILNHTIRATSELISAKAKDDTQRLGMGTTCACAWVIGYKLFTASVGDSRIYLLRGERIHQLTVDHTWVQEAVEKGILPADQVHTHPNLHIIRRYLGSKEPPQPDLRMRLAKDESDTQSRSHQGLRLIPGDTLLLCTDGLTDLVEADEIWETVHAASPAGSPAGAGLSSAAQALVNLATSRGGPDNITVVLLAVPGTPAPKKKTKSWRWVVGGLIGLCLLVAVLIVLAILVNHFLLPPLPNPTPFP